jgi:hypothetical protein
VAVAVECQLCKHEVLGSNPNPTKKKKINKKKKKKAKNHQEQHNG